MNHSSTPRKLHRRRTGLVCGAALVGLLGLSGASCPRTVHQYAAMPARTLPEAATLDDVLAGVNKNTQRVRSIYAEHATISGRDIPTLSALVAVEQPGHFRLRAKTAFAGPEIDLGSNPDLFWFWVRRNDPPAVYFCRHSQFGESNVRQMLPVEPKWLIEALGLVTLDPADIQRGPIRRPDGKLEVHTMFADAPEKPQRITVLDEARGWVLEQHVFDHGGQRLASATARDHRRDPESEATLPGMVDIYWPPTDFALTIELREPVINQLRPDAAQLWVKPQIADARDVDVGDPSFQPPPPQRSARVSQASYRGGSPGDGSPANSSPANDERFHPQRRGPGKWLGGLGHR